MFLVTIEPELPATSGNSRGVGLTTSAATAAATQFGTAAAMSRTFLTHPAAIRRQRAAHTISTG